MNSDMTLREMRMRSQRIHRLAVTTPDREQQNFYIKMALEHDFLIDERLIELRADWRLREGKSEASAGKSLVA